MEKTEEDEYDEEEEADNTNQKGASVQNETQIMDTSQMEPDGEGPTQKTPDNKTKAKIQNKVNKGDFLLFDRQQGVSNTENQRLLSSFGIENLAMFFIKYRVDKSSVNDPFYQQLIYQCYNFLVSYVKGNLQNQIKVHDNLDVFLRDIDKNPLICLLIYEMFKDNKKFLTLNVSKILRQIILSAEESALNSSKKALYLKLLEVFCKFEDQIVRPNQQEIVINFTRDVSKNNLIYLFSYEGLPHLIRLITACLPNKEEMAAHQKKQKEAINPVNFHTYMSIEVYNVMVCLDLMSICCEGKSDLAEVKCQTYIVNLSTALQLYEASARLWPFKCSMLKYICHCYLDSGNSNLFSIKENSENVRCLKKVIELIKDDLEIIQAEWHKED